MKIHPTSFHVSRRDFLKQSLLGLAGLALPWKSLVSESLLENLQGAQANLGRVLKPEIWLYSAPRISSRLIGRVGINSILPILQTQQGETDSFGNYTWYQIASSLYIHSSGVQIVENKLNPIVDQIPSRGKIAQLTVPYAKAWKDSFSKQKSFVNYFYGSNHWVTAFIQNDKGISLYEIQEDRYYNTYYVEAKFFHIFSDEELKGNSPAVSPVDKRIEVHLNDQTVVAYEKDRPVFHSPMSSGLVGENKNYSTPPGIYKIISKRPSRHMTHADRAGGADPNFYGVPWVSYFTNTGIAFHGTYWHNEFSYPHSHGCINLPIDAAQWIYLWSDPVVPPPEIKFASSHGTKVIVS